jgi:hypothetical protein
MTIVLLVEGSTEIALKQHIKAFLDRRALAAGRPKVRLSTRSGIPVKQNKLRRWVELELSKRDVTAVVGLIDVYPGFEDAAAAKTFLQEAAGDNPNFHAHAAQYDVEAWLLPYWEDICRRVGVHQSSPGGTPELVNQNRPPSYRLRELFQRARPKRKYVKTTEMYKILRDKDLTIAADRCPEFKSFLNTLLWLADLNVLE